MNQKKESVVMDNEIVEINASVALRSETMLTVADELARFIKERHLATTIQGREYVNVDGWQYAGSRLGIVPIVEKPIRIVGAQNEIKYECSVSLYLGDKKVGYGYAICSNAEPIKRSFAEYAIVSMAQTRAIGKAYRNLLAWTIKAAGFETTPAEEMEGVFEKAEKVAEVVEFEPIQPVKPAPQQAPKTENQKSSNDMSEAELRDGIMGFLRTSTNGNVESMTKLLEDYTKFMSKDGNLISGVRDVNRLAGKRLEITYKKIRKDFGNTNA